MGGKMQSTYSTCLRRTLTTGLALVQQWRGRQVWSKFRNCRKACEWRYIQHLVPVERDHNLAFGAVIHDCLELWHRHRDLDRVLEHIDRTYPERAGDEKQRADWHLATAMMRGWQGHTQLDQPKVAGDSSGFSAASNRDPANRCCRPAGIPRSPSRLSRWRRPSKATSSIRPRARHRAASRFRARSANCGFRIDDY
jgi:hypothetical protein